MSENPIPVATPRPRARNSEGGKKSRGGGSEKPRKSSVGKASHKTPKKAATTPGQIDEYVGRKVQRYWPQDGGWVSGAISDFNAVTGEHCIVYDLGTPDESWEWYNIR